MTEPERIRIRLSGRSYADMERIIAEELAKAHAGGIRASHQLIATGDWAPCTPLRVAERLRKLEQYTLEAAGVPTFRGTPISYLDRLS